MGSTVPIVLSGLTNLLKQIKVKGIRNQFKETEFISLHLEPRGSILMICVTQISIQLKALFYMGKINTMDLDWSQLQIRCSKCKSKELKIITPVQILT